MAVSPIAQAAEGRLRCYVPDVPHKACKSLASYVERPDGEIENRAEVLISAEHQITMTTTTVVAIRHRQVCGRIARPDIANATFRIGDAPADDDQTAKLRAAIGPVFEKLFGHQVCTAYEPQPNGASLIARASIDGVRKPDMDQTVIWVSPADGYRVAP
jgi:hypothetical protein